MQKFIHQLKKGDVVHWYGANFLILEDAQESFSHAPQDPASLCRMGPSACAYARSVCIGGQEVRGYIQKDREWLFQGNHRAGTLLVTEAKK